MKAQSAVEYLMTYGWMLLAIGIVGTSIYSITDIGGCTESASGFTSQSIQVDDFGINTENQLEIQLSNAESQTITVTNITLSDQNAFISNTTSTSISSGSSNTVGFNEVENSEECTTADVTIVHDRGSLTDQQITGTITLEGSILETEPPSQPTNLNANLIT